MYPVGQCVHILDLGLRRVPAPHDARESGVAKLQVGPAVAAKTEHALPVEGDVLATRLLQIVEDHGPRPHGIGGDSEVVLYSRDNIQWATRVWWMMRAIGFNSASVLDGGFDKWETDGRPTTTTIHKYPTASLTPRPRTGMFCDSAAVLAAMEEPNTCVINALRESLHDGSEAVNYGRPGRIPGSVNVPGISLLDPDTKVYRPLPELKRIFAEAGALNAEKVVIYCGGGIAATSDAFTLMRLGKDAVTIYDASMSEWANDPSLPMETG